MKFIAVFALSYLLMLACTCGSPAIETSDPWLVKEDTGFAGNSPICAGPWCGAVCADRATIKASILPTAKDVNLIYSQNPEQTSSHQAKLINRNNFPSYPTQIVTFKLTGLEPNTRYHYILSVDSAIEKGTLKTFPDPGERTAFRFALSSCSKYPFQIFFEKLIEAEIDAADPEEALLFFCHMGDLHYADLKKNMMPDRLSALEEAVGRPGFKSLFKKLPVVYTWDDHDFLGNNSGGGYADTRTYAKEAMKAYREFVPHYDFVENGDGIYQEFLAGNVLFLLADTRYNRTHKEQTILGQKQKEWLKQKFIEGKDRDLIVWVNSMPWIDNGGFWLRRLARKMAGFINSGWKSDTWYGFSSERRELAQFIEDNNVTNLCMISGDAHMMAIDDGSNNRHADKKSDDSERGFPVFHAAPIYSSPSRKGGDYTRGKIGGTDSCGLKGKGIPADKGQYGIFKVSYEGDKIRVRWEGKRLGRDGQVTTLICHEFVLPITL